VCAHAVRVVVRKIDGVRDVTVSLKQGLATIHFAPTNRVSVEQIRKAVRSNGYTPRAAEVRVAGLLVARDDTLVLSIPGSEESYVLQDAPGAVGQVASLRRLPSRARVLLNGQLPDPSRSSRASPKTPLLVRSFSVQMDTSSADVSVPFRRSDAHITGARHRTEPKH
jgi:copper chaperone CopZ